MDSPPAVTRIILVVLDGLRADSIPLFALPRLMALSRRAAATFSARTVQPSVTAAAMTSLFTGVRPCVHGVENDRFGLPRPCRPLTLLPQLLGEHGVPVHAFVHAVARSYRGLATHVADRIGASLVCHGQHADEILDAALPVLRHRRRGLQFLHWPDADRAGHAHGWMSPQYVAAAREMDRALGALIDATGVVDDPHSVLIACADHGGGGMKSRDHDSDHPLDTTIPIVIAGGSVARGELLPGASLLDIPATVAWALGIPVPESYEGRPLAEAFRTDRHAGEAARRAVRAA